MTESRVDTRGIDRSLVRGVAWTGAAKWSTQAVTWGTTLILARLLAPGDFGIISLATLYLGFVALFNEMGLGTAVVRFRDLRTAELSQLNTVSLVLGLFGFVAACVVAVPLGYLFRVSELPLVIVVMSLSFVINSVRTVPAALLQREFRFRFLALNETVQAVVMAGSELILAWLGFRYWSLVWGELAGLATAAGLAVAWRPQRFAKPVFAEIRRVGGFTFHLLIGRILWYFYSNADFAVVGRVLGKETLGMYQMAWNLSNTPLRKITELVGRVTPSVFSAVQDEPAALRRYVLAITEGISLVTFPLCVGLALVSDDFVRVALGPKWVDAIVPLSILAFYMSIRTVHPMLAQVLTALGETAFIVKNGFLAVLVMPTAFVIGARWGMSGVAAAWVVAYPIVTVPMYVKLFRCIAMPLRAYLRSLWPATLSVAVMSAGVLGTRLLLAEGTSGIVRLGVQVGVGAFLYPAAAWWLFHERVLKAREVLRGLQSK